MITAWMSVVFSAVLFTVSNGEVAHDVDSTGGVSEHNKLKVCLQKLSFLCVSELNVKIKDILF